MSSARPRDDDVRQILDAANFFGRLGLPTAVVEVAVLKRQYRKLALSVHPDKCCDPCAKEAFQKLSEAFDCLATEDGQRSHLAELSGQSSGSQGQKRRKPRPKADGSSQESRWWDTRTWEEFERNFRHRDAAEAALHKEFASGVKAKNTTRRMRAQLLAAERSAEHCDRSAGLEETDLWPSKSRNLRSTTAALDVEYAAGAKSAESSEPPAFVSGAAGDAAPGIEEREMGHQAGVDRLLDLLTHLRTVHRYCLYCGCVFDSIADLERNCPGFTEEDHDNAPNSASRTSKETAIESAGQIEAFQQDPLDVFMAGMQDQLNQDLKSSAKSARQRDQPQKGWSFEQQGQQNRNERKRLKPGR